MEAWMHGQPWTKGKMSKAIEIVKQNGAVTFSFGQEKIEKLELLNDLVFKHRPDIYLHGWHANLSKFAPNHLELLSQQKNIRKIYFSGFTNRELIQIGKMKQLVALRLGTTHQLDIEWLANLKRLKELELYGRFKSLDPVANCVKLSHLSLSTTIGSFDFFKPLEKIKKVWIDSCRAPSDFTSLNHPSLKELGLTSITKLSNIDSLGDFAELRSLTLSGNQISTLPDMSGLKELRHFKLGPMAKLKNPEAISSLPKIKEIEFTHINTKLMAEAFFFLTEMSSLDSVDIQFLDYNKRRIEKLVQHFHDAGKAKLVREFFKP